MCWLGVGVGRLELGCWGAVPGRGLAGAGARAGVELGLVGVG